MAEQWPLVVWVQNGGAEMIEYDASQHELDAGVLTIPANSDAGAARPVPTAVRRTCPRHDAP